MKYLKYSFRTVGLFFALASLIHLLGLRYPAPAIQGSIISQYEQDDRLRIATYNIRTGKGLDNKRDLSRIANVIKKNGNFDLIALNELEGRTLMRSEHQAARLAMMLDYDGVFIPTEYRWFTFNRGNGFLSRLSRVNYVSSQLPYITVKNGQSTEGRSFRNYAIVRSYFNDRPIVFLITHLDTSRLNEAQLDILLGRFTELLDDFQYAVLIGDLNNRHDSERINNYIKSHDLLDATSVTAKKFDGRDVDWIIAHGLKLVDAGLEDKGPSDHGFFWAEFTAK